MPQDLDQQVKQRARSCMKPEAQQNNSSAASDITRGGEGGTSTPTLRMPQKAGLRRPTVLSEECCDWPLPSDSKLGGGGGTAIPTLLLPKKAGLRRPTNPSGARCDMPLTAESKRGGGAATPLTSINLLVPEKAGQRRPTMPPDVTQSNTSSLYVVQDMDDETETEIQLPEESKKEETLVDEGLVTPEHMPQAEIVDPQEYRHSSSDSAGTQGGCDPKTTGARMFCFGGLFLLAALGITGIVCGDGSCSTGTGESSLTGSTGNHSPVSDTPSIAYSAESSSVTNLTNPSNNSSSITSYSATYTARFQQVLSQGCDATPVDIVPTCVGRIRSVTTSHVAVNPKHWTMVAMPCSAK